MRSDRVDLAQRVVVVQRLVSLIREKRGVACPASMDAWEGNVTRCKIASGADAPGSDADEIL